MRFSSPTRRSTLGPSSSAPIVKASRIAAAGGQNAASNIIAAQIYAADVVAGLAAEGELDATDTQITAGALAETCSIPPAAASLDLFLRAVSSPILLELPPVAAAEIQLRLLLHLDVAAEVSLWRRTDCRWRRMRRGSRRRPERPSGAHRGARRDHGQVDDPLSPAHQPQNGDGLPVRGAGRRGRGPTPRRSRPRRPCVPRRLGRRVVAAPRARVAPRTQQPARACARRHGRRTASRGSASTSTTDRSRTSSLSAPSSAA